MEAEEVIDLLDSYWFGQQIFKRTSINQSSQNPDLKFQENSSKPKIFSQLSKHRRSSSDQMMNSMANLMLPLSDSPNSVLQKKQSESDESISRKSNSTSSPERPRTRTPPKTVQIKKKKPLSKSLSELEFEEVKGFMDLGFVFSEEDRESSLVDIIPGLQRIGKDKNEEDKALVSRPYLSEAWDEMDKRKRKENNTPLMNWRIPSVNDEIKMKDNLKWWAQAVASTVK